MHDVGIPHSPDKRAFTSDEAYEHAHVSQQELQKYFEQIVITKIESKYPKLRKPSQVFALVEIATNYSQLVHKMLTIGDGSSDQVDKFSKEAFELFCPGAHSDNVANSSDSNPSYDKKRQKIQNVEQN